MISLKRFLLVVVVCVQVGLSAQPVSVSEASSVNQSASEAQPQKPGHTVPRPPSASDQKAQDSSRDSVATFRSEVKLVNVFATVTDQHGAPVASLKKDDFTIFEDGQEQKIAIFDRESELPLSIVIGIDASLSTRKDLPLELQSARRFAHTILRPQDAISLYQFSEIVNEMLPFTGDLKRIDQAIGRVRNGSATALYDAVYLGSDALTRRKGRKVMVVITDGGDTASKVDYQEALRAAQIAEAILYPIIMVPIEASAGRETGGEHALIQLSIDTGGKYYYASSMDQLDQAFRRISEELRTQYLVGYYPPRSNGSEFRRIEIKVQPHEPNTPGPLLVRHRTGYYTSKLH